MSKPKIPCLILFLTILLGAMTLAAVAAGSTKPTTNKGAICANVLNFGDVSVSVNGENQTDGIQGMAIAGDYLYTAIHRKGAKNAEGTRPSLYTRLIRTDLKTLEKKTIVTDYDGDPNSIGLGHANDMTAVTVNTNTYILVTRTKASATLLKIDSEGVIVKTAVIPWEGATPEMEKEVSSNQMGSNGLAFTSVKNGIAQLMIANKATFYTAEINLRDMTLSRKLEKAFTISEENIHSQIKNHFGAFGQKYTAALGSGWAYQSISYDRRTNKLYLPLSIIESVNGKHLYHSAVLVYDSMGNPLPSEGFAMNEVSMEIEGLDFYGSYLYWNAICYSTTQSGAITQGNRVFRMWTKVNFSFDASTDHQDWTYNKSRISTASVNDGLLSLTPVKVTDGGSQWLQAQLQFSFPQAELAKIKFRITNCDRTDTPLLIKFHVSSDEKNWKTVRATPIKEGDWYLAAIPVSDEMKEVNAKYLRVVFSGINGRDATSSIDIDYIFIGPEWVVPEGHLTETYTAIPPTCTEDGKTQGQACRVCGKVIAQQELIPPLGHSYSYTQEGELHEGTCTVCSYSFTENHSYSNGICICGAREIPVPITDESIVINHSLNLTGDISVNYVVKAELLSGYDSFYMEVQVPSYKGSLLTGSETVFIEPELKGSYYYFTLTGITAVQMADLPKAVLHMTMGSQPYISNPDSYSVASYAYSMLNNSTDSKMLTLCADLLRYGARAQLFKGYRTDCLADANMTDTHKAYLSDLETIGFGNTNRVIEDLDSAPIVWVGKSLNLESRG